MKTFISILTLALLTTSLTSAVPRNEEQKKEGITTPSGVVLKTLRNTNMEGDDEVSMDEEDSKDINLKDVMNECNETFVIPASYVQALNESGSLPDETDRNPKCYIRCVLEKAGVASENGVFNPAQAAVVLAGHGGKPMDDVEAIATECAKIRDESCKCERSYQFIKCVMEMKIQRYEKSGPQQAQKSKT